MNSEAASQLIEWAVVLSFFAAAVGLTFAEASWMQRKGWTNFGNGFVYSLLSNFVGISIGSVVIFIAITGMFMVVWDGSINKLPNASLTIVAVLVLVLILVLLILAFCKWIVLKLLKIQLTKSAWAFSLISSVLTLFVTFSVPILVGYVLYKLF